MLFIGFREDDQAVVGRVLPPRTAPRSDATGGRGVRSQELDRIRRRGAERHERTATAAGRCGVVLVVGPRRRQQRRR